MKRQTPRSSMKNGIIQVKRSSVSSKQEKRKDGCRDVCQEEKDNDSEKELLDELHNKQVEDMANQIIDSVRTTRLEPRTASNNAQVVRRSSSGYSSGSVSSVRSGRFSEPNGDKASSRLSTLGGLLKRNTSNGSSPVQSRIAKKIDQQQQQQQSSASKRAQFTQARSQTGLNIFGGRRRSIAITDDAYKAAMRAAKSHLDLHSQVLLESEKAEKCEVKSEPKPRAWIELERLWRGKVKHPPPDLDEFLASSSSQRRKAQTLPSGGGNNVKEIRGCPEVVAKKAIHLMSGEADSWRLRFADCEREEYRDHFSELLRLWNNQAALPSHLSQEPRSSNRVDRSQSCKLEKNEPKRGATRERRKHSDPNIPRSTTSDADSDAANQAISDQQPSGSSSSSDLSARSSLDSPATSMHDMAGGRMASLGIDVAPSGSTTASTSSSQFLHQQQYWDSDFETEPDPPDWRHSINQEELNQLTAREKKKQDVINEFFHTEKSHVRNLKVLDRLFFRPLRDSGIMAKELLEQLFPNLDDVLSLHIQYNQKMKERAKAGFPVGNVGDMLCEMFEGPVGDQLVQVGAEFTKNQKLSIEELKDRRKRDHKLDLFLMDAEKKPECRRLGLQSLLPVEHQRLVKYPLLLEQLAKQCDKDDEEYAKVRRCVDRSREILESIDRQVAEAQNIQRLAEIQRNLDTSGLEKMPESAICAEYRNLDLTKHRLIYDGPLTLKLGDTKRFKTIDLHVVLLEDCIMLLQKQDDKYLLKFHTSTVGAATVGGSQGHKFCHSPVIKFSAMLVRPVATDKRAFYLLNTTQNGPQIYELVASSTADRTQWFRHITEASNAYRAGDSKRRRYPADPLNGLEGGGDRGKTDDHLGIPDVDKKGNPAGRSQSFHEQSTSSREPQPERQPSSPPEERGENSTSLKAGDSSENGSRKRFQRVEILKIAEPCPLIDPSQVVVTQGEILVADPVLTPIEKIRRKDREVAQALEEKHRLVAEYYHLPYNDLVVGLAAEAAAVEDEAAGAASEAISGTQQHQDAREVLMAALVQVKSLSDLVNESLTLSEEDAVAASSRLSPAPPRPQPPQAAAAAEAAVEPSPEDVPSLSSLASEVVDELPSVKLLKRLQPPTHKLIAITKAMNQHLTSLLEIIHDRDEERDLLRKELQRTRALLSQSSVQTSSLSAVTSPTSRPASFISVEDNSGPETTSERYQESEDDAASPTTPTQEEPPKQASSLDEDETTLSVDPQDTENSESSPVSTTNPTDDGETEECKTIEENTEDDSAV